MQKDVIRYQSLRAAKRGCFRKEKGMNWSTKTNWKHQVQAIMQLFHHLVDFSLLNFHISIVFIERFLYTVKNKNINWKGFDDSTGLIGDLQWIFLNFGSFRRVLVSRLIPSQDIFNRAQKSLERTPFNIKQPDFSESLDTCLPDNVLNVGQFAKIIPYFVVIDWLYLPILKFLCDQLAFSYYVKTIAQLTLLDNILASSDLGLLKGFINFWPALFKSYFSYRSSVWKISILLKILSHISVFFNTFSRKIVLKSNLSSE